MGSVGPCARHLPVRRPQGAMLHRSLHARRNTNGNKLLLPICIIVYLCERGKGAHVYDSGSRIGILAYPG